jgi:hypothetical protein
MNYGMQQLQMPNHTMASDTILDVMYGLHLLPKQKELLTLDALNG